jgi:hypothetical protein
MHFDVAIFVTPFSQFRKYGNITTGENEMKINLMETRRRFELSGRKLKSWADRKGINSGSFDKFIHGRFSPDPQGDIFRSYVQALGEDGLLVWEEERKAA